MFSQHTVNEGRSQRNTRGEEMEWGSGWGWERVVGNTSKKKGAEVGVPLKTTFPIYKISHKMKLQ